MISRRNFLQLGTGGAFKLTAPSVMFSQIQGRNRLPDGLQVSVSQTTLSFCGELQRWGYPMPDSYRHRLNVGRGAKVFQASPPDVEREIAKFFAVSSVRWFVRDAAAFAGLIESAKRCDQCVNFDSALEAVQHAFRAAWPATQVSADEYNDERFLLTYYCAHYALGSVRSAQTDQVNHAGECAARAAIQHFKKDEYENRVGIDPDSCWIWDLCLSMLAGALKLEQAISPSVDYT